MAEICTPMVDDGPIRHDPKQQQNRQASAWPLVATPARTELAPAPPHSTHPQLQHI